MAKRIVALLVLVVVGFFAVGFLLPSEYAVSRERVIQASPETIYESVANLRAWAEWTAWTPQRNPSLKYSYEGSESGEGAIMRWTADEGPGSVCIVHANARTGIAYEFTMEQGVSQGSILLQRGLGGQGTKVLWTMNGDSGANPIGRYFGYFMDDLVGPDFEHGLAELARRAEDAEKRRPPPTTTATATTTATTTAAEDAAP